MRSDGVSGARQPVHVAHERRMVAPPRTLRLRRRWQLRWLVRTEKLQNKMLFARLAYLEAYLGVNVCFIS